MKNDCKYFKCRLLLHNRQVVVVGQFQMLVNVLLNLNIYIQSQLRKQRYMKHFKILSQLGIGSFGKVELAQHLETGQKVAIKTISKQKLKTKEDALMVSKQIAVFKSIRHENIIKLYQIVEDQCNLYLVMQYADKGDLLNYLKGQNFVQERVALKFMQQLISAVKYLHTEKSIAHRDIKLANILLYSNSCNESIIKLADFGLSNFYDKSEQKLKTSCGSPCYSAPQILKGRPYCPIEVDVWSLGVVFYAMIQGTLPFYDENVKQLYRQVIKGKYFDMEKASPRVQNIIKKILVVNPELRLSIEQFQTQINQMIALQQIKKQNKNLTMPVHKLSLQSNEYIQNGKVQIITKIMILKGYSEQQIEATMKYIKQNKRQTKFNHINCYIELLKKKPFNKLRELLNTCYIQSKQNDGYQQLQIELKRTQSNYTRDTLKSSARDQKKVPKAKFVRSNHLGRTSLARRQNFNISTEKDTKIQGLVIKKRKQSNYQRDERIQFQCKDITKQYNSILSSIGQMKNGYIRLKSSNNFSFASALSQARQIFETSDKKYNIAYSLNQKTQYKLLTKSKSKNDINLSITQSENVRMKILTERYRNQTQENCQENQKCLNTFSGPFNIMHTFTGPIKQVIYKISNSFKNPQKLQDFKYLVKCPKTQKDHIVQIMGIQNFTNLKVIKVEPFSSEILRNLKQNLSSNTQHKIGLK